MQYVKDTLKGLRQLLATEIIFKMMKMFLISPKKQFSLLRQIYFSSYFFGHVGKQLDNKDKIDFKIYVVINWEKTTEIHMLPNISRSKGNQTKKRACFKFKKKTELSQIFPKRFCY